MKEFAEQLSDCLMRKGDIDVEMAGIIDAAKEQGINTKALKRVAKELATDSERLAKKLEDEAQLDMFRAEVKLRERKGLVERQRVAA